MICSTGSVLRFSRCFYPYIDMESALLSLFPSYSYICFSAPLQSTLLYALCTSKSFQSSKAMSPAQGCNKKFAQSTNLKSHILTHAKQKSGRGSVSSPDSVSGNHSLDRSHLHTYTVHIYSPTYLHIYIWSGITRMDIPI